MVRKLALVYFWMPMALPAASTTARARYAWYSPVCTLMPNAPVTRPFWRRSFVIMVHWRTWTSRLKTSFRSEPSIPTLPPTGGQLRAKELPRRFSW